MARSYGLFRTPAAVLAALAVCAAIPTGPAAASEATAWAKGAHSEARLIDGGAAPSDPDVRLAGLELRLDPAFVTYWRDPGDAGVPPVFDFTGSTNLKSADVRFPAPTKLDEAGATAFGYEGDVTLPIVVAPADPSKPVGLKVDVNYAVCHDICLPARAALRLDLDGAAAEAGRVTDALAAVPRIVALGETAGPLAVLAITPARGPDAAGGFTVEVKAPPGAALFVEAPEAWSYAAGAGRETGAGQLAFPVKRVDAPQDAAAPPVILTLVAPRAAAGTGPVAAIEVHAQLDGAPKTP